MYTKRTRFFKSREGASAVEFVIVAPFLIYILSAIFGYGLLFITSISVRQLGADAARATIGGLTLEEKQELARTHLADAATDYPLLEPDRIEFQLSEGKDAQTTVLVVTYQPDKHPIEVFRGVLPLPERSFRSQQSIREHRG